jgi:hypothetical protein
MKVNSPGMIPLLTYLNTIIGFDIFIFGENFLLMPSLNFCPYLIILNIIKFFDGRVIMAETLAFHVGILGDIQWLKKLS